jgi:serine phosphatase RsbU (regulator of sigma subunit)
VTEIRTPGEAMPLGVLPGANYVEVAVDLEPGDVVICATDGLPEAPAAPALLVPAAADAVPPSEPALAPPVAPGEFYGFERLMACAAHAAAHAGSAEAVLDYLWQDVSRWCDWESHHDDMTLLVLRVPG